MFDTIEVIILRTFTAQYPLRAIKLINELSLFSSIFCAPLTIESTYSTPPALCHTSLLAASLLDKVLGSSRSALSSTEADPSLLSVPQIHPLLLSSVTVTPSPLPRLFLGCALTPYRSITYVDAKQKQHLAVEAVIREGLKLGTQNHYLDGIPALFTSSALLQDKISEWHSGVSADIPERVAIGNARRLFN